MVEALERADFSTAEVDELLQILAGLLHLSNVSFTTGEDDSLQLQDTAAEEALNRSASLLGLEGRGLEEVLRCRRIVLKGDILCTKRNEQQCSSACTSLIKFIYSRLFDHIVQRLNDSAARHVQGQQTATLPNARDSMKSIGSKPLLQKGVDRHLQPHSIRRSSKRPPLSPHCFLSSVSGNIRQNYRMSLVFTAHLTTCP